MTDLTLVTKIAGGGIAVLFTVMITLSLTTWVMSLVARRIVQTAERNETKEEMES